MSQDRDRGLSRARIRGQEMDGGGLAQVGQAGDGQLSCHFPPVQRIPGQPGGGFATSQILKDMALVTFYAGVLVAAY